MLKSICIKFEVIISTLMRFTALLQKPSKMAIFGKNGKA